MEKSAFIRLNPKDNVIVARRDVPAGVRVENEGFTTLTKVPAGYKVAARDIRKGEQILKYNTCIGFAAEDTPAGTMMHSHNIVFEHVDLDYAFSKDYHPTELLPPEQRATFQGFVRPDGRVATRNYIGILVASNCAATVARKIADHFTPERLAAYPNVTGVVPFITGLGCGMEMTGPFMDLLRRTIMGYATNPNLGAAIVVALGCERNNIDGMFEFAGVQESQTIQKMVIQDIGGTAKAIEEGIARSVFHHNGEDTTTWFSQEGDVTFGMDSLYYQQPSVESVETLSDCKIYVIHIDKLNALYETYIDIANWGRILHQNVNKELSHMFVERLQLSPKERYEQFNRRYPGLINRVKLKYVAAFLGISIYTLSRVRAKK